MIWFTSDTHFWHTNILRYCSRPFESVSEMKNMLVSNWNDTVRHGDKVYHLGDFAFGNPSWVAPLVEQLQGNIVLVAGNHDRKSVDKYFQTVVRGKALVLELDDIKVECIHNPRHVRGLGDIALCGHVHGAWVWQPAGKVLGDGYRRHPPYTLPVPTYNMGVDVRNFHPVSLQEILNTEP